MLHDVYSSPVYKLSLIYTVWEILSLSIFSFSIITIELVIFAKHAEINISNNRRRSPILTPTQLDPDFLSSFEAAPPEFSLARSSQESQRERETCARRAINSLNCADESSVRANYHEFLVRARGSEKIRNPYPRVRGSLLRSAAAALETLGFSNTAVAAAPKRLCVR